MKANFFVTIYRKNNTAVTELYKTITGAQARALSSVDGTAKDWDIIKYGRASGTRVDLFGAFYAACYR